MTAPAIALMILTILLVWGGLVASVVLLQVLSVPTDEETGSCKAVGWHREARCL